MAPYGGRRLQQRKSRGADLQQLPAGRLDPPQLFNDHVRLAFSGIRLEVFHGGLGSRPDDDSHVLRGILLYGAQR